MKNNATVFSVDDAAMTAARFAIVRPPKNKAMEEESDNPLGDYVRSVMQENGLSAQDVSNIALRKEYEIGRATIGQIVNGKTPNPLVFTRWTL